MSGQGKLLVLCHRLLFCHMTAREGDKRQYDISMSPFFLVPSANIRGHLEFVKENLETTPISAGLNSGNVDCHCDLYMGLSENRVYSQL